MKKGNSLGISVRLIIAVHLTQLNIVYYYINIFKVIILMRSVLKCVFFMFCTGKINCRVSRLEHFVLMLKINKTDANHCNCLFVFFN